MKMPPKPHEWDEERFRYGKRAGDNKFGFTTCPTCGRGATHPTAKQYPGPHAQIPAQGFFMFRDGLSAKEYYISGMCQSCQDAVFSKQGEDPFDPAKLLELYTATSTGPWALEQQQHGARGRWISASGEYALMICRRENIEEEQGNIAFIGYLFAHLDEIVERLNEENDDVDDENL